MLKVFGAAAAALLVAAPAMAQTVDGVRDASYGSAKSTVTYLPGAPNSNFGAPTPFSDAIGYDIYLTSSANKVFGFFQASGPGTAVAPFANLYFDIDPSAGNGSDLGFEIGAAGVNAFVPGMAGSKTLGSSLFSVFAQGNVVEFSLANSLFSAPISGLTYYAGQTFPSTGDPVTLRLSQSFGYSVAGGATYGANRLGSVNLVGAAAPAVPEPATWAMLLMGFGVIGFAMRRRSAVRTSVRFA